MYQSDISNNSCKNIPILLCVHPIIFSTICIMHGIYDPFTVSPITKAGKQLQLLRVMGLVMIPVAALLSLVGFISITRITDYMDNRKIQSSLELG